MKKKQLINIIEYFKKGKILSLISDAGTPLLSDPGRLLVNKCIEKEIGIIPVPGVSSVTSALSVSGFKDQFLFYGFLPKKENELVKILTLLSQYEFTQVFFIPSKKINFYIKNFKSFFSGRKILIAKEMTKIHETFIREDIDKIKLQKSPFKGELTIIISEKNDKKTSQKLGESDKRTIKRMINKFSTKEIINFVNQNNKISKKIIYDFCLKLKNEKSH